MGQRRCCIPDCPSQSNLPEHSHVTFHSFPTNVVLRDVWIKNCRIQETRSLTKSVVVCSRHFLDAGDFQAPRNGKRMLKTGAAPTQFSWGTELSYEQYLLAEHEKEKAAAAHTDNNDTTITATNANESIQTPTESTSHGTKIAQSAKKSSSRLRAAIEEADNSKLRSASTDEQTSAAIEKSEKATTRKSLDSIANATQAKSASKQIEVKSPLKRLDSASTLASGAKVEVLDLNGAWHAARVVEVDQTEQEVFISFEKSAKTKGPTALNDEWIPMDSSRLRIPSQMGKTTEASAQFKEGEKVLARWTDSRKFPGTVNRVLENNLFEIIFDDGCVKHVKGGHISKQKRTAADTSGRQTPNISLVEIKPPHVPITPSPIPRKSAKINPIPKFDLSKFNLPEIPADGEWCCPWINDTPIGRESFLTNTDGNKRPTVLVEDPRLPGNWTKHLYQRSSTSGKWDVVLVGPNNKRFRSKNDVKTYLEELGQTYNPDVYDFSIHKRRAKDLGVYVFTEDYVPPVLLKPNELKFETSVDTSISDIKQEPFTGFAPHEASTSFLSGIVGDFSYDASTPIKLEPVDDAGFTQIGSLKVQIKDNLYHCPKEGCNKTFRKENIFQIHVKHYHPDLLKQIGDCPNMTELAYFRTKGTPAEENVAKAQSPATQVIGDKAKIISPTQLKTEPKIEDASASVSVASETIQQEATTTKRKLNITQPSSHETKEKRKPTTLDKVVSPDVSQRSSPKLELLASDISTDADMIASTPISSRKTDTNAEVKQINQKPQIPRFKIGKMGRLKGTSKLAKRENARTLKKKFKRGELKRRTIAAAPLSISDVPDADVIGINIKAPFPRRRGNVSRARSRLKFLQYRNENAPAIVQRGNSRYINENGELIKIVRMRQEEIINCLCTYPEEDGLMIQCELCLCWQHGGCNGIEKESEVPEKYVCYICRNPNRGRESMKYIHDQEWLYEGKLPHATYHRQNRNTAQRSDILKQSHSLTGNLIELKRSLHSLNVKISIAGNKDHPKLYLWSKKWEHNPKKAISDKHTQVKKEDTPKLTAIDSKANEQNELLNAPSESTDLNNTNSSTNSQDLVATTNGPSTDEAIKSETKIPEINASAEQTPTKQPVPVPTSSKSRKHQVQVTPTIPEPEAAIDPAECQLRLMEHIQKEQNTLLSRMQTIDAHIMALEAMDDHPDTNSKADFARTSQTIRMLMRDLSKVRKLAAINDTPILYNAIDAQQYV